MANLVSNIDGVLEIWDDGTVNIVGGKLQIDSSDVLNNNNNALFSDVRVDTLDFGDASPTLSDDGDYLKIQTTHGYTSIGAGNTSFSHFYTDRNAFYFDKRVQVNSGQVRSHDEDLNLNRAGSTTARLRLTSGTTISDQDLSVTGDVTISGDLTVSGDTVTLNTTTITAEDAVILLNSGQTTPANDIGLIFQRYSTATSANYNPVILWEESSDKFVLGSTTEAAADADIGLDQQWLVVTGSGNVGIGSNTPGDSLVVSNGTTPTVYIGDKDTAKHANLIINRGSTSFDANLIYKTGNVTKWRIWLDGIDNTLQVRDEANASNIMTWETGGNVGINVDDPNAILHIKDGTTPGTAQWDYRVTANFEADNGNTSHLELTQIRDSGGVNDWTRTGTRLQQRIDSTYMGYMQFNGVNNTYGISWGSGGGTAGPEATTEKMRLEQNGNVGIGTTDPSEKLHVQGNIKATGNVISGDSNSNVVIGEHPSYTTYGALWLNGESHYRLLASPGGSTFLNAMAAGHIYFRNDNGTLAELPDTGGMLVGGNSVLTTADEGTGNGLDADTVDGLHASQFLRSDADDTMSGKLILNDVGYSIGNEYHKWKRVYSVSTSSPQELLNSDGNSLVTGGVYRFTAHISGTGTDQFATAVYWNQNGTWRINVTGQSGTGSNHPEFIIDGSTNKPAIHIDHASTYSIHILGERIELDEGAGTDNAGFAFGTDAFLGSVNNNLYFLPGGTTATGQNSYDDGNIVWHQGNDGSGSGLDADTVDGLQGSSFLRSDQEDSGIGLNLNGGSLNQANDATLYVTASNNNDWGMKIDANAASGKTEYGMTIDMPASFSYGLRVRKNGADHFRVDSAGAMIGGNYVWHAGNDGSGSGLDADLLDGQHGSYYMPASTTTISQSNQVTGNAFATTSSPGGVLEYQQASGITDTKLAPGTDWYNSIRMGHGNPYSYYSNTIAVKMTGSEVGTLYTQTISNNNAQGWNKHWHDNNDGSGSGLDADTVDGIQGSSFLRSDASDSFSGTLTYSGSSIALDTGGDNIDLGTLKIVGSNGVSGWASKPGIHFESPGEFRIHASNGDVQLYVDGEIYADEDKKVFHTGNDGPGSGLDADTVDGIQGASFLRSDTDDTLNNSVNFGTANTGWNLNASYLGQLVYAGAGDGGNQGLIFDPLRYKATTVYGRSGTTWTNIGNANGVLDGNYAHQSGGLTLSQSYDEFIIYFSSNLGYTFMNGTMIQHSTNGNSMSIYIETIETSTNPYDTGWNIRRSVTGVSSWPGGTLMQGTVNVGGGYDNLYRIRIVPNWNSANSISIGAISSNANYGSASKLYSSDFSKNLGVSGDVTAYYSDVRLKTNTGSIENALEKVCSLDGFYYLENDIAREHGYNNERQQVALSAQAVQAIMPEVVSLAPFDVETDEAGNKFSKSGEDYLTINYAKLVPLLVESIKEQQTQIDELKDMVKKLTEK